MAGDLCWDCNCWGRRHIEGTKASRPLVPDQPYHVSRFTEGPTFPRTLSCDKLDWSPIGFARVEQSESVHGRVCLCGFPVLPVCGKCAGFSATPGEVPFAPASHLPPRCLHSRCTKLCKPGPSELGRGKVAFYSLAAGGHGHGHGHGPGPGHRPRATCQIPNPIFALSLLVSQLVSQSVSLPVWMPCCSTVNRTRRV